MELTILSTLCICKTNNFYYIFNQNVYNNNNNNSLFMASSVFGLARFPATVYSSKRNIIILLSLCPVELVHSYYCGTE